MLRWHVARLRLKCNVARLRWHVARLRLKCNVARLMWRCCWIEVAVLLG